LESVGKSENLAGKIQKKVGQCGRVYVFQAAWTRRLVK
jgi:hypothetical protein